MARDLTQPDPIPISQDDSVERGKALASRERCIMQAMCSDFDKLAQRMTAAREWAEAREAEPSRRQSALERAQARWRT
jgi:hypothetical protein